MSQNNNSVANNKRESFRKLKNSNEQKNLKSNEEDIENKTYNNSSLTAINEGVVKNKRRSLPKVNQFRKNSSSNDSSSKLCACCNMTYLSSTNLTNSDCGKCELCLQEICEKCNIITKVANKIAILCKICSKLDIEEKDKSQSQDFDSALIKKFDELTTQSFNDADNHISKNEQNCTLSPLLSPSANRNKAKRKLPSTPISLDQNSEINSVQASPYSSHLNINQKIHQPSNLSSSKMQVPSLILSSNNEAQNDEKFQKPKLENVAEWLNKSFDTKSIASSKANHQNLYIPERQQRSNSLVYLKNDEQNNQINYNSNALKQKAPNYLNDSNCDDIKTIKQNSSSSLITLNTPEKIKISLLDKNNNNNNKIVENNLKITSYSDLTAKNNDQDKLRRVSVVSERNIPITKSKNQQKNFHQIKSNKFETSCYSFDINKSENNIHNEEKYSNQAKQNNKNHFFSNTYINSKEIESNGLDEIQISSRKTSPTPSIEPISPLSPSVYTNESSKKSPIQRFNMPLVRSARNNEDKRIDRVHGFSEISFKFKSNTTNGSENKLRSDSRSSIPTSPLLNPSEQSFIYGNNQSSINNSQGKMQKTNSTSSSLANFRSSSPYNPIRINSVSSTNSNDITNEYLNNIGQNTLNKNGSDTNLITTPIASRKNSINDFDSGIDSSIKSDKSNKQIKRNYDVTSTCDLTLPEYVPLSNNSVDLAKILENMKTSSVMNKSEKLDFNQTSSINKAEPIKNENETKSPTDAPLGELQVIHFKD